MVTKTNEYGLIMSPALSPTAELDELATETGWPVILGATVRRVSEELDWRRTSASSDPRGCLVFWIQERDEVAPTVRLVRWLRDREPRSCRIALAYCLEDDVEPMIRGAGVHVYLPASGSVSKVVRQLVWPVLERSTLENGPAFALPRGGPVANRAPPRKRRVTELGRPP